MFTGVGGEFDFDDEEPMMDDSALKMWVMRKLWPVRLMCLRMMMLVIVLRVVLVSAIKKLRKNIHEKERACRKLGPLTWVMKGTT